ncbi:MAG: protein kinase, partial [Rubripirellula sp.]|nr:protein kinase [Rubripirellula sp.]
MSESSKPEAAPDSSGEMTFQDHDVDSPAVEDRAVEERAVEERAVEERAVEERAVEERAVEDRAVEDRAELLESQADGNEQQDEVDQLLDAWEMTNEAGNPVDLATLCEHHPKLIGEVRERIAALQKVDAQLDSRKKNRKQVAPVSIAATIDQLQFVNAGGLGEVFVGEDSCLRRRVAVKFMHSRLCLDQAGRDRFALEAEVTGRLEHPGVVPLYGSGCTEDNQMYYAMRYIDGETLDDAIDAHYRKVDHPTEDLDESEIGVEFQRLLANFVSVCKTIGYAHNRGIVHRDIKPANVMLGRFGETIVVDWGLAVPVLRDERFKSSGEETLMPSSSGTGASSSGRGAGTPAFMSPEQASELAPTPAGDIYSLGATLFKILSGKPPIKAKSIDQIRHDLIDGKLPVLREIRSGIPEPLQAITYKAMSRDAKNRYQTASELAEDIERFLADEPVTAVDDPFGVRIARMARKHRLAAQAAVLGLCACLLIAGVSSVVLGGLANRAQRLQNQNLVTSSELVARSLSLEVDRTWRVLESIAATPELCALVAASNQLEVDGDITLANQSEVQQCLDQRLGSEQVRILERMFILSRRGTQLARSPLPDQPQVGINFAFRDYFTGLGFDLERESRMARSAEPLAGPAVHPCGVHMSPVYLSTLANEQQLKVTLTVPIYRDGDYIGVLGTSMDVGIMMRKLLGKSDVWLVDLRETMIDGKRVSGILLAHPDMEQQARLSEIPRLPNATVDQLHERFG